MTTFRQGDYVRLKGALQRYVLLSDTVDSYKQLPVKKEKDGRYYVVRADDLELAGSPPLPSPDVSERLLALERRMDDNTGSINRYFEQINRLERRQKNMAVWQGEVMSWTERAPGNE